MIVFITVAVLIVSFLLLALGVAPITAVTGSLSCIAQWNAAQTLPNASSAVQQPTSNTTINKKSNYSVTGAAVANGINQVMSRIYSVAGGGTTTIDLTAAIRNVVNDGTATLARIKGFMVRLLSVADDATNGTAASSITLGNSGANDWTSQGGSTGLGSATSTFVVKNGSWMGFGNDDAAGTVIDATHKNLKIANNDGAIAAAVELTFFGADA